MKPKHSRSNSFFSQRTRFRKNSILITGILSLLILFTTAWSASAAASSNLSFLDYLGSTFSQAVKSSDAPNSGTEASSSNWSIEVTPTPNILVVSPSNLQGWQTTKTGTATVTFETGPATPPLGTGSVELNVGPNGDDAAQVRHPGYVGTMITNLTALSYSAYVDQGGSGGQAPYIILQIDLDGSDTTTGDRTLLFYEPVYQTNSFCPSNSQSAIAIDTWQT
jgi:hypothetical protein